MNAAHTDRLITARINARCVALDPIHHGAGTIGNTSVMRTEERINDSGERVRVPFVSGASMRHMLREHGVLFALEAMGVDDNMLADLDAVLAEDSPAREVLSQLRKSDALMRSLVVLLLSGGQMTSAGATIKLDVARRLERLFPILSLMGYSAGNRMTESRLRVQNMYLACDELGGAMRDDVLELPASRLSARQTITEIFGTRKDATEGANARRLLGDGQQQIEGETADLLGGKPTKKAADADPVQMIWDTQAIMAGSVWQWSLSMHHVRPLEVAAFQGAIERACEGVAPDGGYVFSVGAKRAQGFGRMSITFDGDLRRTINAPEFESADLIPANGTGNVLRDRYIDHLREHRGEILSAIVGAAS